MLQAAQGVSGDARELQEELTRLEREWQDIAHGWVKSMDVVYDVVV